MPDITRIRAICDMLAHPDLSDDDLDEVHAGLSARLGIGPAMRKEYPTLGQGIVPSTPYPPGTASLRSTGGSGDLTDEQKKAALTLIGPGKMKRFMKFRANGDSLEFEDGAA